MKTSDLLAVAAAGLLVYIAWKAFGSKASGVITTATGARVSRSTAAANYATEVANAALPGDPGWGWKYYTDGTAISPDGTYYLNGSPVWSPPYQTYGAATA